MQEEIFTFLLIIWSQALAYRFRFQQVGFFFRNVRILGVLVFHQVANLPIEKVCIIKSFEEANFSDFKRLVVSLKINPQKYNCPHKTCKSLKNTFPGSNWSVIVMRIKQSEVYDKLSVTKFCLVLIRRGTVTNLGYFGGFKNYFKRPTTFLCLPEAISWRNMKKIDFSSCATYFFTFLT